MKKQINHNLWLIIFIITSLFLTNSIFSQDSVKTKLPSSAQKFTFDDDAKELSKSFIEHTGISTEKSEMISQILKDYRNDVIDAKNRFLEKNTKEGKSLDETGSQSRVNMHGILGDSVKQYYIGAPPELISGYRDADKKADDKIISLLDDDAQKEKYQEIKGQWWKSVKDKVFSSLDQNQQQQSPK